MKEFLKSVLYKDNKVHNGILRKSFFIKTCGENIYNDIIKSKSVVITESIGDNLALLKHNINNSIVIFGLNLSSKTMKFLIETNLNHIIISTNNDIDKNSAGNKAAEDIKKKLLNFFDEKRIHVMLPKSKDWGCSSELDILAFKDQIDKLA